MKEFGTSKVKSMRIEYLIYGEGTGFDTIRYQGTSYVKDTVRYGELKANTPTTEALDWQLEIPAKAVRLRALGSSKLLVIKYTFNRGILRKDTVVRQIVAVCNAGIDTGG